LTFYAILPRKTQTILSPRFFSSNNPIRSVIHFTLNSTTLYAQQNPIFKNLALFSAHSLLKPLISETYLSFNRQNNTFKGAFYAQAN